MTTCTYISIQKDADTQINTYTDIYTYTHIYTHILTYIHTHVRMHTYIPPDGQTDILPVSLWCCNPPTDLDVSNSNLKQQATAPDHDPCRRAVEPLFKTCSSHGSVHLCNILSLLQRLHFSHIIARLRYFANASFVKDSILQPSVRSLMFSS